MLKYKPKTLAAQFMDRILRILITCSIGIGWFVALWGFCLPALTAGVALGGLIWLCARQFGKRSTQKREKQMRRMIGGELALQKLLLLPPRHAAFQAALWLTPRFPVVMQKAVEWGILGTLDQQPVLVRLIAQHESQPVSVQQVVECAREMRAHAVKRCILCLTAPACRDAQLFAAGADPPIEIVERAELVDLAGLCSPATDEDLSKLARKKRPRRSLGEWAAIVLDASRARRYFWYGLGLSLLALLTGLPFYPIPAMVCLGLFAACKWREITCHSS